MTSPAHRAPGSTAHPRRWGILWVLAIAQLMLILDITVVTIALPQMGADLGLDREALTWIISAYTLTFGGLLLLGGRLADVIGARAIVLTGLAAFTVASLAVGLAPDSTLAIAGRVGQGVGAALLSPSALSWVVTLFDGKERARALGVWSALGGGGAALGVLVGGLVTAFLGWRWAFFLNVPIGVVLFVALAVLLPQRVNSPASRRIDALGALLVTAGTGVLIWTIISAAEPAAWIIGLVVAVSLYAAFAWRQRTAAVPLMDLRLLTRRPIVAGVFLIFMATVLMITVFLLGSFFFQQHLGFGPLLTGVLFLPVAVATMVGANVAGRLAARLGLAPLAAAGLVTATLGLGVAVIWLDPVAVTIGIALAAAGTGVLFVAASATALGSVSPEEAGVASGVLSTFHEFGASTGAAVMSSVAAASLLGTSHDGYITALLVAAAAALVAAALAAVIIPRPATVGAHV
ncbi:MFS transporter [Microbacterium sp. Sa4CUA7]|uniref:MFS transporter n=1 Tax=Microbacterium pullorum TaxID=2762236 RepID=A0ABR8S1Q0_9MICO|nr:MFS transporter [Microbacterium pullorum]MBD7957401.1 MFS transporter [Microbacterium pullorum]